MELSLSNLGNELLDFIKNSPITLGEVSAKALGIQYHNFQRRAAKNRVRFDELNTIAGYMGLEVSIQIGEMVFKSDPMQSLPPQREIALQQKQIQLQEKVIFLQDELSKCKAKRSN